MYWHFIRRSFSSGLCHRVSSLLVTSISEERVGSMFRVEVNPTDGDETSVTTCQEHAASHLPGPRPPLHNHEKKKSHILRAVVLKGLNKLLCIILCIKRSA
jgi:hypothetical protein